MEAERTPARLVTLEQFAAIAAELAEADRPARDVLVAHGLSEEAWRELRDHHHRAVIADALASDEPGMAEAYATAFARTQDALKPVPDLTPEAWAELVVQCGAHGAEDAVAALGFSSADYLRLCRHWAKKLGQDRAAAQRYAAAFYAHESKAQADASSE